MPMAATPTRGVTVMSAPRTPSVPRSHASGSIRVREFSETRGPDAKSQPETKKLDPKQMEEKQFAPKLSGRAAGPLFWNGGGSVEPAPQSAVIEAAAPKGLFVSFLDIYKESCLNMGQAENLLITNAIKTAFTKIPDDNLVKIDVRKARGQPSLVDEDVLPLCLSLQAFRLKSAKSTQRPNLSLDMSGHNLTSKAIEDFGSILQVAKNLKTLILSENDIGNDNMLAFGVAVYGSQLERLDLSKNKIDDQGMKDFFQGMLNSASVCHEIHSGLSDVASSKATTSTHFCKLKYLHLNQNLIKSAGCQALIALLEEQIDDNLPMLPDLKVISIHVSDKNTFGEECESALNFIASARNIQIVSDADEKIVDAFLKNVVKQNINQNNNNINNFHPVVTLSPEKQNIKSELAPAKAGDKTMWSLLHLSAEPQSLNSVLRSGSEKRADSIGNIFSARNNHDGFNDNNLNSNVASNFNESARSARSNLSSVSQRSNSLSNFERRSSSHFETNSNKSNPIINSNNYDLPTLGISAVPDTVNFDRGELRRSELRSEPRADFSLKRDLKIPQLYGTSKATKHEKNNINIANNNHMQHGPVVQEAHHPMTTSPNPSL
eukprot:gene381-492_t